MKGRFIPMMSLVLTPLPNIPMVHTGDDLVEIIWNGLSQADIILQDGDILVFAQKIVSKAEGRWVNLVSIQPSAQAVELAENSRKRSSPGRAGIARKQPSITNTRWDDHR